MIDLPPPPLAELDRPTVVVDIDVDLGLHAERERALGLDVVLDIGSDLRLGRVL